MLFRSVQFSIPLLSHKGLLTQQSFFHTPPPQKSHTDCTDNTDNSISQIVRENLYRQKSVEIRRKSHIPSVEIREKLYRRQKSAKSVSNNHTAEKKLWKSVENHTSNPWKSVLNSPTPQSTKIHLHIRKNFRNFAHGKHLVTI